MRIVLTEDERLRRGLPDLRYAVGRESRTVNHEVFFVTTVMLGMLRASSSGWRWLDEAAVVGQGMRGTSLRSGVTTWSTGQLTSSIIDEMVKRALMERANHNGSPFILLTSSSVLPTAM